MDILRMATSPTGTTIAVGNSGVIFKSTDGGIIWEPRESGTTNSLYGVAWGSAYDDEYWVIVGQNGLILRSPDGNTWESVIPVVSESLYGVAFMGIFCAVGEAGTIVISEDLGTTWEEKSSGSTEDLYDIDVNLGMYVIIGNNDTVIIGELVTLQKEIYLEERVRYTSEVSTTGNFQHDTTDLIDTTSVSGWYHIDGATLVETEGGVISPIFMIDGVIPFSVALDPSGAYLSSVSDEFAALSYIANYIRSTKVISETPILTTTQRGDICVPIIEALEAEGLISYQLVISIREIISSLTPLTGIGVLHRSITESLTIRDLVVVSWLILLSETTAVTSTSTNKFELAVDLVDRLTASGAASSRMLAVAVVAQALQMDELADGGLGFTLNESTMITDTLLARTDFYIRELVTALMTATPAKSVRFFTQISDAVEIDPTFTTSAVFRSIVAELGYFSIGFGTTGGDTYTGWVMNIANSAVTEYTGFPFNSFAKIGNNYYGASASGIFKLAGSDDAGTPIEAIVRTGISDFGIPYKKRLDSVYISIAKANSPMILKVISAEGIEEWYEILENSDTLKSQRVKTAKGVSSMLWEFEIVSVDSSDFEISSLDFIPVTLTRKI